MYDEKTVPKWKIIQLIVPKWKTINRIMCITEHGWN